MVSAAIGYFTLTPICFISYARNTYFEPNHLITRLFVVQASANSDLCAERIEKGAAIQSRSPWLTDQSSQEWPRYPLCDSRSV